MRMLPATSEPNFREPCVNHRLTKSLVNSGLTCDPHRSRLVRFALTPWTSLTRCSAYGRVIRMKSGLGRGLAMVGNTARWSSLRCDGIWPGGRRVDWP